MVELLEQADQRGYFDHLKLIDSIERLPDMCRQRECSIAHLAKISVLVLRAIPLLQEAHIEELMERLHNLRGLGHLESAALSLVELCR